MFLVHLHWTHQNVILQHLVDVQDVFRSLIFMPFYKPLSLGDRKLCLAKSGWNSSQAGVLLRRPKRLKGPLISVSGTFTHVSILRVGGTRSTQKEVLQDRVESRLPPLQLCIFSPPWWSKRFLKKEKKKKPTCSTFLVGMLRPKVVKWLVQVNSITGTNQQDFFKSLSRLRSEDMPWTSKG